MEQAIILLNKLSCLTVFNEKLFAKCHHAPQNDQEFPKKIKIKINSRNQRNCEDCDKHLETLESVVMNCLSVVLKLDIERL